MAKKQKTSDEIVKIIDEVVFTLYNSTKKYKFEMCYKYNQIYLTIIRKGTSDHHVGTFKFNSLEELKEDKHIIQYFQFDDINEFFKNFKYNV